MNARPKRDSRAVEVEKLTVQFGKFTAVNQISFDVNRGEIFGFLGANGAGKTTTIRVLCGLLTPTRGTVRVAGINIEEGERAIKSKVGYMSQKFTLYNDLTVEENLSFIADLRKMPHRQYIHRRKELFDFISFDKPLTTTVQDLPGGVKQQVSLAGALLHDPEIIFLDEPTAGVSPVSRGRFWSLIRELTKQKKTVFVTTHYMDEAEQCERIALMRDGKILALDTPNGLKKATFPQMMLEFDPKKSLSYEEISELSKHPAFSFFEPYGLRFHAALSESKGKNDWGPHWKSFKSEFEKKFNIRQIEPSLEDVFIHSVEGRNPE